jgi:uncharacterized membrane protein
LSAVSLTPQLHVSILPADQFFSLFNVMDIASFAKDHAAQLTAVIGLISYGLARKKFTAGGVAAGIFVCGIHMIHPWPAFFWLLTIFVFLGTLVTKVNTDTLRHVSYPL